MMKGFSVGWTSYFLALTMMDKKEAKKWIEVFKKAKFKCIVPNQVIEAMAVLGYMPKKAIKKWKEVDKDLLKRLEGKAQE